MRPIHAGARALALLLICAVAVAACGKKPAKPNSLADARVVRVVRVEGRPLAGGLIASGVFISREEAAVGTELSGYQVQKVYVEEGATVRRGQPLAQLDDTLLRAQIEQQAALTAQAQSQAQRVAGMTGQGVLSQEQIETRRFQAQAAQAQLADLRTREGLMTIRAPVAGIVLTRTIRPGDIVSPSTTTPMFTIARDSLVELAAEVPEDALASIHVGDPVQVTLADTAVVTGYVRLIDPTVDATTKLARVRVRLPVRGDLRPGGFGRATFTGGSIAPQTLPEPAIRYDADGASVAVVDPDNRVRQVSVKTGRRAGGYVELLEGPPAGSRVLLGAGSFVLPGDLVRPIEANAPVPATPMQAR
ncbi:MAG: efflux RND transporter periplasmic adaptor subunit [Caulobacteraceae bacterium]